MGTDFTSEQLSAIEYRKLDACVVAGPGSGKTTVLVERYCQLIERHKFEPREILAITFTEKAAANMKAKLAAQFRHSPERLRELESQSWVSTIHGFCMKLLRENAIAAGVDPRFEILGQRESDKLQWECLHVALDEMTERRREATLELIEALQSPALAGELKDVYDALRSAGRSIAEVRAIRSPSGDWPLIEIATELRGLIREWPLKLSDVQRDERSRLLDWCRDFEAAGEMDFGAFLRWKGSLKVNLRRVPTDYRPAMDEFRELRQATLAAVDRHAAPFRAMIFDVLERFEEEYLQRKATSAKVDFNDLERLAIALLRDHAEVRTRVQKQFRQIMLDEFQDINGQQAELISLLRSTLPETGNTFFGVGDRNQSIYGFRHARPEIFLEYRDEVLAREGQSVALRHNFRSREAILRSVRELLANAEGIEDRELVAKPNFAGKDEPSVEILKTLDPANDRDAACDREAAWIAHRVRTLHGVLQLGPPGETRAAEFRDFAVLCRGGDSMLPILAAFGRAGIPYVCGRRQSFLISREGVDITALLHVIANPRNSIALGTLLRSPLVGVSDETLLRLRAPAHSLTGGLNMFAADPASVPLDEPDASRLRRFVHDLERWRQDQPIVPPDVLLSRAIADCGIEWGPASLSIESFLQLARTTGATMTLPEFLDELESLADAAGTEADLADEDQGNCVQVMTAHAAKGLEFPVTIIAAMDKGSRRESRPVTYTAEHGLGVKWRNPVEYGGKDGLKDSWAEANKAVLRARETEEENRLLYVAMTRAEEHLILSYSCGKSRPSNWAGQVDRCFDPGLAPLPEPIREERGGYAVSIRVTDADPPFLSQAQGDAAGEEMETIATPGAVDNTETAVTVTSLAVFAACPRKYYIQRSLGWNGGRFRRFNADDPDDADNGEDADGQDLSASAIGTEVHAILAGLTSAPGEYSDEARGLADVFLKSDLGQRVASSPRVAREWAFIADMDGTMVRGTVDLWFEEDGEFHVVDYKTDAVSAASAAARAEEYRPQLALYALALERALGQRPVAARLHFLRADTVVQVALDDQTLNQARSLIAGLRLARQQLRFDLREGGHCPACPFYRSICPAGLANRATP